MGMENFGFLTREEILDAQDIEREEVPCPEWGGKVIVRTMFSSERDELEMSSIDAGGDSDSKSERLRNYRARVAVLSCEDGDGKRLFSMDDLQRLTMKSSKPLDRILDVAFRLSGISSDDVEETIKNSESGQSEDSGM